MNLQNAKSKIFQVLLILIIITQPSIAQNDSVSYPRRPFQFTFLFPPLSTNGIDNVNCINDVSLNLFIGSSGGVGAAEIGGFINIDRFFVYGTQVAGFGNTVGGSVNGVQLAGFYNVNGTYLEGFQGAGFINVAGADVEGAQIAGFMNIEGGGLNGLQAAGFMNIAGASEQGVQIAGFGNIIGKGSGNLQAAGFFNTAAEVEGAQVAGFMNVAGKVKGAQIAGFMNICDSIDGVPIGFINIVKQNGFKRLELSVNEVQYINLSYKMGVKKLYTIYSFGKPYGHMSRWMFGGGLGTEIDMSEKVMLNIEGTVHQELWIGYPDISHFLYIDQTNLYSSAKFIFGLKLNNFASIHLGPTINVGVSRHYPLSSVPDMKDIAPYSIISYTRNNYHQTTTQIWPGIQAGISF